jgi:hypothetical protein
MNIKLSASMLGLSVLTSLTLVNINPVAAQNSNGSVNGFPPISFPTVVSPAGVTTIAPAVVTSINTAISNGTIPAASITALSNITSLSLTPPPAVISPTAPPGASAAVSAAAVELAKALNGLVVNGVVNAPGVNAAASAYNEYVAKLVAAVGGTEATAILTKDASVKNTLTALIKAGGG